MSNRKSGILLHISSLPSEFGIGDLGPGAYRFVDFLQKTKQHYWQILPINPTDPISQHSPYSSLSASAGNVFFISPQLLVEDGILAEDGIKGGSGFLTESVQYDAVMAYKKEVLRRAYECFVSDRSVRGAHEKGFKAFMSANAFWLDDYALFVAIKEHFHGKIWLDWPKALRLRDEGALGDFAQAHQNNLTEIKFLQYLFFKQWGRLKEYCASRGVRLIGDMPIYVNLDSVDVWRYPQNYKLDNKFHPLVVAGVPPDYFSKTGQRWGNPVYNWDVLKKSHFSWWVNRFKSNFNLFDLIRIDHFRGLVQFWEIPAHEETAVNGKWGDVPSDSLFTRLQKVFPKLLGIIAEDLGFITDDVRQVMSRYGFPGMKVLLFAFNGDLETHPYLPHNYQQRCIVYTGTHDNNTVLGWFDNEASGHELENLRRYLDKEVSRDSVCWDLIQLAFDSEAEIAIIPMQDVLELGVEARMNVPGTVNSENWRWRFSAKRLDKRLIERLSAITGESGRA